MHSAAYGGVKSEFAFVADLRIKNEEGIAEMNAVGLYRLFRWDRNCKRKIGPEADQTKVYKKK